MIVTFEPPHIDAVTAEKQIVQIKNYLSLLSEKLNFVMETLEEAADKEQK